MKKKNSLLKKIKKILKFDRQKVAVLHLKGVIGEGGAFKNSLNFNSISKKIDQAFESGSVKLVALCINSPGGSPVQSELIYKKIIQKSKETKIPVWAFVEDVAASGGYFLAIAAEKIFASKCSIVGSIGVISAGFGFNEAIAKIGVERRVYSSGDKKSILDPFAPEKQEDVKMLKDLQKEIHLVFKENVQERRVNLLDDDEIFSGRFWLGQQAQKLGLIDEIGDFHCVLTEKFGKKLQLIDLSKEKSIIKKFMSIFSESLTNSLILAFEKIENHVNYSHFKIK